MDVYIFSAYGFRFSFVMCAKGRVGKKGGSKWRKKSTVIEGGNIF